MRVGLTMAMALLAWPLAAAGEGPAVSTETVLATYEGTTYALTARCLGVRMMATRDIVAVAWIYTPPSDQAHVRLWYRGSEHGVPIGVFRVRLDREVGTVVSFEETQPGRLQVLARAAALRCGPQAESLTETRDDDTGAFSRDRQLSQR